MNGDTPLKATHIWGIYSKTTNTDDKVLGTREHSQQYSSYKINQL